MFSRVGYCAHSGRGVNKNEGAQLVLTWNSFSSPGVGKIMSLQRCPCPNPQNLWICYVTQQRGITVANQLTLKIGRYPTSTILQLKKEKNRESILNYPGEPNAITRVLKNRRVRQHEKDSAWHCWLWRWKEATSQAMREDSRSWKRQGNGFSPKASRRNNSPSKNHFRLLTSRNLR